MFASVNSGDSNFDFVKAFPTMKHVGKWPSAVDTKGWEQFSLEYMILALPSPLCYFSFQSLFHPLKLSPTCKTLFATVLRFVYWLGQN
jgi:hypothetical protein